MSKTNIPETSNNNANFTQSDPILNIDHFLSNLSIETSLFDATQDDFIYPLQLDTFLDQYQKRSNIQELLQIHEEDNELDKNSKVYLENLLHLNSDFNQGHSFNNPIKTTSAPLKEITDELELVMESCNDPEERAKLCHQMCQDLLESSLKSEIEICNLKTELEKLSKERDLAKEALKKSEGARNQLIDISKELRKENIHIRAYKSSINQLEQPFSKDEYFQNMKNDFEALIKHFNSRGRHFNCVMKSKEIDISILRRKLRQKELLYHQENSKVKELQELLSQSTIAELETRKQLEAYMLKFREVEETLSKNMLLQQNFRSELDLILKKCGMLEKESNSKSNNDSSQKKQADSNNGKDDSKSSKLDREQLEKKCSKLEDIIKGLQEQRAKESLNEKQKDEMILALKRQLANVENESEQCTHCHHSTPKGGASFTNGTVNGNNSEIKFENGGHNQLNQQTMNRKIKTPKSQFHSDSTKR